ncbi:hypothetical protein LTR04_000140, partial [Oleoguttula sp. CCFEE 6159]
QLAHTSPSGFPYPANVALASYLESVVRVNGGVPATIGILNGVARVGLDAEELIKLTSSAGKAETLKISRRDLAFACGLRTVTGERFNGGTTIAGTMILAHLAGIKVFATGGLGGVHRGAESSMDISADLTELGRTPVTVISSGCKSFLDIPRTLEYLETKGVAVATFADGREGKVDFPAFWSRESGVRSPMVLRDEMEAAAVIHAQHLFGLKSGLHFANPVPEESGMPKADMDALIEEAIKQANAAGISGSANTPFVLAKIKELSGGRSVTANRALIEANVKRGTLVAKELVKLERDGAEEIAARDAQQPRIFRGLDAVDVRSASPRPSSDSLSQKLLEKAEKEVSDLPLNQPPVEQSVDIIVAGALAVDFPCDYSPPSSSDSTASPALQTSNPARITQSLGGVAHNIAQAAHLLGSRVRLCSAVADDLSGRAALATLSAQGFDAGGIKVLDASSGLRTAQYVAVNDAKKDLFVAMADMSILEAVSTPAKPPSSSDVLTSFWLPQLQREKPNWLVLDANWPAPALHRWLRAAQSINAKVAYEPVSTAKAPRLFTATTTPTLLPPYLPSSSSSSSSPFLSVFPNPLVHIATPNIHELSALHAAARAAALFDRADWWSVIDALGIPPTGARVRMALASTPDLVDAGVPQMSIQLLPFIPCILAKLGQRGVLLTQLLGAVDPRLEEAHAAPWVLSRSAEAGEGVGVGGVYMRLFGPAEVLREEEIVSVNGVGDTFLGTLMAGLVGRRGEKVSGAKRIEDLVGVAQMGSCFTLRSAEAVSPRLGELRRELEL